MEKATAYVLILLSALVIYGLSQNYVGQVSKSNPGEITGYGKSGQPIFEALLPPPNKPVRQNVVYSPSSLKKVRSTVLYGNTTNTTNHTACVFNTCIVVSGPGSNQCLPVGSLCGNITNVSNVAPAPLYNPGCEDSDNNNYPTINYFVKGTATVTFNNGATFSQTDACNLVGSNVLTERYCTSPTLQHILAQNVSCTTFNMTCSNGRCV